MKHMWVYLFFVLDLHLAGAKSMLSTFHPESLNIDVGGRASNDVADEAIHLMKHHFLRRHLHNKDDWNKLKSDVSIHDNRAAAAKQIMSSFDDPYTRYIDKETMSGRKSAIRGRLLSAGISLKRCYRIEDFGLSLKCLIEAKVVYPMKDIAKIVEAKLQSFVVLNRLSPATAIAYQNPIAADRENNNRENRKFFGCFKKNNCNTSESSYRSINSVDNEVVSSLSEEAAYYCNVLRNRNIHRDATQMLRTNVAHAVKWGTCITAIISLWKGNHQAFRFTGSIWLASVLTDIAISIRPIVFPIEIDNIFSYDIADKSSNNHENTKVNPSFDESNDLQKGDRLLQINDVDVGHLSLSKVKKLLNDGEYGDIVELTILRKLRNIHNRYDNSYNSSDIQQKTKSNKAILSRYAYRDYYNLNTQSRLTYSVLPPHTAGCGVGYVSMREFCDESFHEFKNAIEQLKFTIQSTQNINKTSTSTGTSSSTRDNSKTHLSGNAIRRNFLGHLFGRGRHNAQHSESPLKALIIDLRGNPGGTLVSALDIAALFLPKGTPLIQLLNSNGRRTIHFSKNRHPDRDTALLILVDSSSASASEVMLEALCDNGRASSMGTRTVGKNLAQALVTLSDGSGLVFTIMEFFTPTGRYMGHGHQPDVDTGDWGVDERKIKYIESDKSFQRAPLISFSNPIHY